MNREYIIIITSKVFALEGNIETLFTEDIQKRLIPFGAETIYHNFSSTPLPDGNDYVAVFVSVVIDEESVGERRTEEIMELVRDGLSDLVKTFLINFSKRFSKLNIKAF